MSDNERREPAGEEEHHVDHPENAADVEVHSDKEDGGKKKDKYDKSGPHPIIGLIVFLILQFIALLFVTVATPIELYTLNDEWRDKIYPDLANSGKKLCVTAWGMKAGCRSRGYYNRDYTNSFCYRMRVNFKIVEAFCIMTIGFMTIGLVVGILSVFQKIGKGSVGVISTFSLTLCLIPWGVLAGMYHQKPCCETFDWYKSTQRTVCDFAAASAAAGNEVPRFKTMGKYAGGFGLLVTAWALQVIACVFAYVPL